MAGGKIKVTSTMVGRWVKAVFLVILGIVILYYTDAFVREFRNTLQGAGGTVAFDWTWDLLRLLMWILAAWLFVDAALTVAQSFSEHRYSLADVMKRLDSLEKKLGVSSLPAKEPEPSEEESQPEVTVDEEVPPPPKE